MLSIFLFQWSDSIYFSFNINTTADLFQLFGAFDF